MCDIEINDIREPKDFKGFTFSKFKKTDVFKELLNNLNQNKIEPACYWSAELICAGYFSDLWEIIILFYSKYIHLGNPKIAIYLDTRINSFKNIIHNSYANSELQMRNNGQIRRMFCEIMCVLCDAKRKHSFAKIKIKSEDYDITQITDKFNAPNINYADDIFYENDPRELFVAINELAYNISLEGKNVINACYWIEWIIEFEAICKRKKIPCKCERRSEIPVEPKNQMDVVWMIWSAFFKEANKRGKFIIKVLNSILKLFTLKYTSNCNRKRVYVMYFVVSLLCETVNTTEEIIREKQKDITNNIINNIDLIYKQIKKNEIPPDTDYLSNNPKNSNMDKTIKKLDQMNIVGVNFIPRI